MLKWFTAIVITFSLGYYFGHSMSGAPAVSEGANHEEEIRSLKEKIAELETKLKNQPITPTATLPSQTPVAPEPVLVKKDDPPPPESPQPISSPAPKKKWRAAERNIPYIRTQADIAAFLDRSRIDDFMSEVQTVKPITQPDEMVDYLNGNFSGVMTSQSDIANFNIVMGANIRVQNQQLRGRVNVRLSRNGKPFSRNSNNGEIQNIQKFSEKSLSVLITTGDFFFQLYYIPALESFDGNCYQQTKPGVMQFVGTVHLDRV